MSRPVHAGMLALALCSCAAHPPAHWAAGGAHVDIARARWDRDGRLVEIMPEGRVMVDGEHWFTLDRAGRVFAPDNDPVALLETDGRLVGKDNALLGVIGLHNSSLPGRSQAWLTVLEQGHVFFYDEEGERHGGGAWLGCGPAVRTCTLVTHMVALAEAGRGGRVGVGAGFGSSVGIGFGVLVRP